MKPREVFCKSEVLLCQFLILTKEIMLLYVFLHFNILESLLFVLKYDQQLLFCEKSV